MNCYSIEKRHTLKRGVTLVEAALTLGVSTMVIAAVILTMQTLFESAKTRQSVEDVRYWQSFVTAHYNTSPIYTNLSARSLIRTGEVNKRFLAPGGSSLVNAYGGTLTLNAANHLGGRQNTFQIQFADLPRAACVAMATEHYGRKLVSVYINSRRRVSTPVSVSVATQRCNRDQNWVTFRFL